MEQETINKVATGVKVFGGVLFVVCLVLAVWSIVRPGADAPLSPEEKQIIEQQDKDWQNRKW